VLGDIGLYAKDGEKVDRRERSVTLIVALFQAYRVLIGSLLLVFVPQHCPNYASEVVEYVVRHKRPLSYHEKDDTHNERTQ